MNEDILNLPSRERRMVAVQRFKHIVGEYYWNRLLEYLNTSSDEFIDEYGDKLLGNPHACDKILIRMLIESQESWRGVP